MVSLVCISCSIGCCPSRKEWAQLSNDSHVLMRSFGKLKVENGLLVQGTKKYCQLVLPESFHKLGFVELHEKMAHLYFYCPFLIKLLRTLFMQGSMSF